jgi:ESCRT-II complex subunit VPS22
VGAIKKRAENAKSFANTGRKMEENQIQHVQKQLDTFKSSLQDFAAKHKKQINADPEFRHRFHMMCSSIGVDPLASGKGFWSDLLGVGDFYYEYVVVCGVVYDLWCMNCMYKWSDY